MRRVITGCVLSSALLLSLTNPGVTKLAKTSIQTIDCNDLPPEMCDCVRAKNGGNKRARVTVTRTFDNGGNVAKLGLKACGQVKSSDCDDFPQLCK
jgi:hypothetical protein